MNKLEQIIKGIEEEKKFVMENFFMSESSPTFTQFRETKFQVAAFDTALTVIAKLINNNNEVIEEDGEIIEEQQAKLSEEAEALKQFFGILFGSSEQDA
ncbi:MAG: hypothetical protein ACRCWQ_01675 [Bacilli bacterium]